MTIAGGQQRKGHAVLDLPSRRLKGKKIEAVLGLDMGGTYDLLEVGTGSGGIAHYFATAAAPTYWVTSVDVTDARLVTDGYTFHQVHSTDLPFADNSFDVVVSNHVIEHVGETADQLKHLREVARVLRSDGTIYLAVPNRWMVVEPHYGLFFLSWLPRAWRTPYLRRSGKGDFYDCEPLQKHEVESLASAANLSAVNVSLHTLRHMMTIEGVGGPLLRAVLSLPSFVLDRLAWLIPIHIYLLKHKNTD